MKKITIILTFLYLFSGCCDIICERQKHAEDIIEKVENYKLKTGKLPQNIKEIGMEDTQMHLSFYEKLNANEYQIWYGLDLGNSMIYNSKTKKWRYSG